PYSIIEGLESAETAAAKRIGRGPLARGRGRRSHQTDHDLVAFLQTLRHLGVDAVGDPRAHLGWRELGSAAVAAGDDINGAGPGSLRSRTGRACAGTAGTARASALSVASAWPSALSTLASFTTPAAFPAC